MLKILDPSSFAIIALMLIMFSFSIVALTPIGCMHDPPKTETAHRSALANKNVTLSFIPSTILLILLSFLQPPGKTPCLFR